jgi:acyl-CoA synthetase (AMP-forming)/AMP-acid ligase II
MTDRVTTTNDRDPQVGVMPWDPLAISFMSGTIGPLKGVLASHGHVITFAYRKASRSIPAAIVPGRCWLGIVPAIMMGGRIAFGPGFRPPISGTMRAISVRMWRPASSPRCRFC